MNLHHFQAFVWLRWRINVNSMKKGGIGNTIILGFLAVSLVVAVIALTVGSFMVGLLALGDASPAVIMYVWDGFLVGFLFCWMIGLMADLQRADSLSLDKFLHLPVSLKSAFLINYFGSLVGLTTALFVPTAVGLTLGLLFGRGPAMLLLAPLIVAMIFAVTAVSYQFQGWLASLMSNPRRRRGIIAMLTLGFITLAQLPNLINIFRPWGTSDNEASVRRTEKIIALTAELQSKQITLEEHNRRHQQIFTDETAAREAGNRHSAQMAEKIAGYVNLFFPPGWLALGAHGLAENNPLPMLLGTLGLGAIGAASLLRSYRTTLRLYTGHYTAGQAGTPKAAAAPAGPKEPVKPLWLLELRLPRVPEQVAAVAAAGFRSLTRAPEAKMALLTPLILGVLFGGVFLAKAPSVPQPYRPLIAFCGMMGMLFTLQQLIGNQFGYDRSGFRAFVLGPVPRRHILTGKNLAFLPLGGMLAFMTVVLVQCFMPMRIDHFFGCFFQFVTMFVAQCLVANLVSIFAPLAVASGTAKGQNVKFLPIFLHMMASMASPVLYLPAILPFGIETALVEFEWLPAGVPLSLMLNVLVAFVAVFVYLAAIGWQGRLLQAREQKILEIVVSKAE